MNQVMVKCEELREDGVDIQRVLEFLDDGEALNAFGFTDEDQADIEDTYYHYNELLKRGKE